VFGRDVFAKSREVLYAAALSHVSGSLQLAVYGDKGITKTKVKSKTRLRGPGFAMACVIERGLEVATWEDTMKEVF
jgi:hypothetical protein